MTEKHQPTDQNRKTVESMAAYGIPHDDIARVLGVDPKTLRLHYREELDTGHTKANAKVAESQFLQAVGAPAVYDAEGKLLRSEQPRVPSCGIWWTKARMGWRETVIRENVGKDGGPQEHVITTKPYDDMSLEELQAELNARSAAS